MPRSKHSALAWHLTVVKPVGLQGVLGGGMKRTQRSDPLFAVPVGVAFGLLLFGVGFVLGTARTVLLTPTLGRETAVLVEIPFMLVIAWIISARLMRACAVPAVLVDRTIVAVMAFAVGMSLEVVLGMILETRSAGELVAFMLSPPARAGLLAQILVFLYPVAQLGSQSAVRMAKP